MTSIDPQFPYNKLNFPNVLHKLNDPTCIYSLTHVNTHNNTSAFILCNNKHLLQLIVNFSKEADSLAVSTVALDALLNIELENSHYVNKTVLAVHSFALNDSNYLSVLFYETKSAESLQPAVVYLHCYKINRNNINRTINNNGGPIEGEDNHLLSSDPSIAIKLPYIPFQIGSLNPNLLSTADNLANTVDLLISGSDRILHIYRVTAAGEKLTIQQLIPAQMIHKSDEVKPKFSQLPFNPLQYYLPNCTDLTGAIMVFEQQLFNKNLYLSLGTQDGLVRVIEFNLQTKQLLSVDFTLDSPISSLKWLKSASPSIAPQLDLCVGLGIGEAVLFRNLTRIDENSINFTQSGYLPHTQHFSSLTAIQSSCLDQSILLGFYAGAIERFTPANDKTPAESTANETSSNANCGFELNSFAACDYPIYAMKNVVLHNTELLVILTQFTVELFQRTLNEIVK
jgi:hypothetical protein